MGLFQNASNELGMDGVTDGFASTPDFIPGMPSTDFAKFKESQMRQFDEQQEAEAENPADNLAKALAEFNEYAQEHQNESVYGTTYGELSEQTKSVLELLDNSQKTNDLTDEVQASTTETTKQTPKDIVKDVAKKAKTKTKVKTAEFLVDDVDKSDNLIGRIESQPTESDTIGVITSEDVEPDATIGNMEQVNPLDGLKTLDETINQSPVVENEVEEPVASEEVQVDDLTARRVQQAEDVLDIPDTTEQADVSFEQE